SRISGEPVTSDTAVTGRPASRRCFAVPPVEISSMPSSARPRAKSTRPDLSDTESRARRVGSIRSPGGLRAAPGVGDATGTGSGRSALVQHEHAVAGGGEHLARVGAAGGNPDVAEQARRVGNGAGVREGGDAEGAGAIVEVADARPESDPTVFGADARVGGTAARQPVGDQAVDVGRGGE